MTPEAFSPHRDRLVGLAYRMLGSVAGAEDVVQEAWLRWSNTGAVDNPGAWLTTVTTRLCLDELKSARARRETYTGPWLPEPWVEVGPPEGPLGASLDTAFLLLLEELSPKERAAFLLREVFEEDYARVAEVLHTSEANARQLVRRAHQAIEADRPRFDADPATHLALLTAFGAACQSGDIAALVALLQEDAVALTDGGGEALAALRPIHGADRVARFLAGVSRKAPTPLDWSLVWVNGAPGLVGRAGDTVAAVVHLAVQDGRIARCYTMTAPSKLTHVLPATPAGRSS